MVKPVAATATPVEYQPNAAQAESGIRSIETTVRAPESRTQQGQNSPIDSWGGFGSAERARLAGRALVARMSADEVSAIQRERAQLAMKIVSGRASEQELKRLAVLDWELDRIEDAKYGHSMDRYKLIASATLQLGHDLRELARRLPHK